MSRPELRATTVVAVRHKGMTALGGDGQVTLNNNAIKHHAKKVRRIYNNKIIVGFAGATADALNLSERLEEKLEGAVHPYVARALATFVAAEVARLEPA